MEIAVLACPVSSVIVPVVFVLVHSVCILSAYP